MVADGQGCTPSVVDRGFKHVNSVYLITHLARGNLTCPLRTLASSPQVVWPCLRDGNEHVNSNEVQE